MNFSAALRAAADSEPAPPTPWWAGSASPYDLVRGQLSDKTLRVEIARFREAVELVVGAQVRYADLADLDAIRREIGSLRLRRPGIR